jgi:ABC-type multidrug transport system ATPase subunit
VLIFDEPTANVISEDAELIRDVISMLGERKTVIIFTEKITLANQLAKHIGIMANGKMALWSSLDNIKAKLNNDVNALLETFLAFTDDSIGGAR